ncbi:hypothetical protein DSECCO2_554220 [anaerobic digester metagenome]
MILDELNKFFDNMGWGTDFNARVYISRKHVENRYDAEMLLADTRTDIAYAEKRLISIASMTPTREEWERYSDMANGIIIDVEDILGEYRDAVILETKLQLYLDSLNEQVEV